MIQTSLIGIVAILMWLGLFVWRSRSGAATSTWFAGLTFAIAGWALGIAGLQRESPIGLSLWLRLTFASASLIPPMFLALMQHYPAQNARANPTLPRLAFIIGIAFSVLSMTTSWISR